MLFQAAFATCFGKWTRSHEFNCVDAADERDCVDAAEECVCNILCEFRCERTNYLDCPPTRKAKWIAMQGAKTAQSSECPQDGTTL